MITISQLSFVAPINDQVYHRSLLPEQRLGRLGNFFSSYSTDTLFENLTVFFQKDGGALKLYSKYGEGPVAEVR